MSIFEDDGKNNVWANNNIAHWITATLKSKWTNCFGPPYAVAGYYKDGRNIVWLKGVVDGGDTGTVIFSLPLDYAPAETYVFPCYKGTVEINSRGEVIANSLDGGNRWWLNGISFTRGVSLTVKDDAN